MYGFKIMPNEFLKHEIQGYFHLDYIGYHKEGNPDFINDLKNQFGNTNVSILQSAANELVNILNKDFPLIKRLHSKLNLTVCVIPRAKAETHYSENQKLFRRLISDVTSQITGLSNGTSYIIRHQDTKTTHLAKSGWGGEGDLPYVGITKNTCNISNLVRGKDILLIDDIYTKNVNIDEDAIQALIDSGAKSVIFYAIAKTYKGGLNGTPINYVESKDLSTFLRNFFNRNR